MLFSLAQESPVSVWVKRGKCSLRHQVKDRDKYLTTFQTAMIKLSEDFTSQSSVKVKMSGKEIQGGLSHIKLLWGENKQE